MFIGSLLVGYVSCREQERQTDRQKEKTENGQQLAAFDGMLKLIRCELTLLKVDWKVMALIFVTIDLLFKLWKGQHEKWPKSRQLSIGNLLEFFI